MAPNNKKKVEYGTLPEVVKPIARKESVASIARPPSGLMKTQGSFHEDLKNFAEGTIPQSVIVALLIGKFKLA